MCYKNKGGVSDRSALVSSLNMEIESETRTVTVELTSKAKMNAAQIEMSQSVHMDQYTLKVTVGLNEEKKGMTAAA